MDGERNKFTEVEMIVGGLGALLVDGICAVIDIITVGIGAFITPVIQITATGAIEYWISKKGGDFSIFNAKRMGKYASNLLPVIPTVLAIFLRSAYLHNHPKVAGLAGKVVGKITPKTAGPATSKVLKKAA